VLLDDGRRLPYRVLVGPDLAVPNFRFRNRGNTAIIGWNAAIFDFSVEVPG
jgi:NADH dehydrogenase